MSVTRIFCFVLGIGLLAAPLAQAQRGGPGGGGFGGGGGSTISNEAVQKELELSKEQIEKLKIITDESQKTMREMFSGQTRPAEGEDREKARAAMQEKMQAAAKEITSKVEAVLTPEQKKRLKEITLQTQGTRALVSDVELAKALNITEEQKKKIEEIRTANRPTFGRGGAGGQPGGGQPGGGAGGAGGFERFQEQQKETDAKIMEVLTAEQKTSYETMKGKKFDMPRPTFGQGVPGGNRPGGTRPGTPPGDGGGDQPKAPSRPEPEL